MRKRTWAFFIVVGLLVLSFAPLFPDPWHEKTDLMTFWEWVYREVWEMIHGEK